MPGRRSRVACASCVRVVMASMTRLSVLAAFHTAATATGTQRAADMDGPAP
jgi:hypothetical protein